MLSRRARNLMLFTCSLTGTVLLVLAVLAFGEGSGDRWLYLMGAVLAFACLASPGWRLRPPPE